MLMLIFAAFVLLSPAQASPLLPGNALSRGIRDIPWGPHETFPTPPGECGEPGVLGIERTCADILTGNVPVTISYQYEEGVFFAALIQAKGLTACKDLRVLLDSAWGKPTPKFAGYTGATDTVTYFGGIAAAAAYSYDRVKDECFVAATHLGARKEADRRRQAKNKGVGGGI